MPSASLPEQVRARGVTAVLGPTNTGKTHLAIERMIAHSSGIIGLPLRLLAREVYGRIVDRVGAEAVALITGEEKIKPPNPRYWVATTEAMPRDMDVAFMAVDEIQLAADADRGHIFTDALLNRRGREETLLIGAATMKPLVERLLPGANVVSRPRLSKLTFAGDKKLTRLPRRSAIVAFSAEEVYAIAELIRRQRGGAAVVLGALSPRTRNAQVELFQAGDVDHIIATDAIGMGLNLDIDHVAFAGDRKFDGYQNRRLTAAEFGQIAGRAGRHVRDGTFGSSGRCAPFDQALIDQIENHSFEPVRMINWRNPDLDFRSIAALQQSLAVAPDAVGLTRANRADDEQTFDIAVTTDGVRDLASTRDGVRKLWEVCQLPDYRKVAPHAHAELAVQVFDFIARKGVIPADWFAAQVNPCDRMDGEIDTLSARIAQVRTWTFCANRDWLADPEHWQGITRTIEDKLSDALHERLAARFVDRRTSVLMRRLRENAMLEAEVTSSGDVVVEGQHVGTLQGFRFTPDPGASGPEAKALQAAALKALSSEIETRAKRLSEAGDESFALSLDGTLRWIGEPIAKLQAGDKILEPRFLLLANEHLTGAARDKVDARVALWLSAHIRKLLGPLFTLESGDGLEGLGRGVAFQVAEHLGVLDRTQVANDVRSLDQGARGALRKLGLRFGAYHIYVPALLKPAPRALAAQLWTLKSGSTDQHGLDDITHMSASGRTSFPADENIPKALYRAAGFRVCGPRAIRVDILERLADLIRPAIAFKPGLTHGQPPAGAFSGDGFTVTVAMTSLAGCAGEDFAGVLKSLGYRSEKRPPMPPFQIIEAATTPLSPVPAAPNADSTAATAEDAPAIGDDADGSDAQPIETAEADGPAETAIADASDSVPPLEGGVESAAEQPVSEPPADEQPAADVEPRAPDVGALDEAAASTQDEVSPVADVESAEAPAVEAVPATEPELVEVWRPARFERPSRERPQSRDRAQRRGAPAAAGHAEAAGDGAAPQQQRWRGQRPGGGRQRADGPPNGDARAGYDRSRSGPSPIGRSAASAQSDGSESPAGDGTVQEQGAAATPAARTQPDQQFRRDDRRDNRKPGGRGPDQRGSGQRGPDQRRDGNRQEFNRQDYNRQDYNRQDRQPRAEKQPDPDSPFAKLLALKQQLEAQKGKS
jgi:ATP-dependent RNA helicase SUPV3L1/SUV3